MIDNKIITNLILDAQNGSEEAFNELYKKTNNLLFSEVVEIIHDENLSYDIVHDTYLKVLQSKMKNCSNGLSYLITIARNLAINSYNKRKREVSLKYEEIDLLKKDELPTYNDDYINEVMSKCLSSYQEDLIKLHVIDGFTHLEIAKKLDKPVGTIMWQYNEAIKAVRKYLNKNKSK